MNRPFGGASSGKFPSYGLSPRALTHRPGTRLGGARLTPPGTLGPLRCLWPCTSLGPLDTGPYPPLPWPPAAAHLLRTSLSLRHGSSTRRPTLKLRSLLCCVIATRSPAGPGTPHVAPDRAAALRTRPSSPATATRPGRPGHQPRSLYPVSSFTHHRPWPALRTPSGTLHTQIPAGHHKSPLHATTAPSSQPGKDTCPSPNTISPAECNTPHG